MITTTMWSVRHLLNGIASGFFSRLIYKPQVIFQNFKVVRALFPVLATLFWFLTFTVYVCFIFAYSFEGRD